MTAPTIAEVTRALADGCADVVVEPPGAGDGYWAGGPSAVYQDGQYVLAYRLRRPVHLGRGYANVVARSADGITFQTLAELRADRFDSASLERPALVQRADGGWRIYVSCSTLGSKHWWVEAVDTRPGEGPEGLTVGARTVVLPGDSASAWKDVVVTRDGDLWSMSACRHPLDAGEDEADRMETWFASSADGLNWDPPAPALQPEPGTWYARGTRLTSAWTDGASWSATFDGRADATENWHERTGFAAGPTPAALTPASGPTLRSGRRFRYVSVVPTPAGTRLYFEAERGDGANDLRTVWLAAR